MRVLVDGGNSGSDGYLRYLGGILSAGALDGVTVLLVCSPTIERALGQLDPQVTVRSAAQLDDPRRRVRLSWWRSCWPRLVEEFRPDVVLHPAGFLRGRVRHAPPRVAVHHNMAPFTSHVYRQYGFSRFSVELALTRARLIRSFHRAEGVVFLADHARRAVSRQAPRIARTTVVPNAAPAGFLGLTPHWPGPLPSPVTILTVSSLHLFKHQWNVVDAVHLLRGELGMDLRIHFVGGGEPRARVRLVERIGELQAEQWAMLGEDPAGSMLRRYTAADVFVFPSSAEAWPITLAEAMACGLPIACSDRMVMPDILRDAGVYFDPESPTSISTALRALLLDDELRAASAHRAHGYAQAFTWQRSAAGLVAFLRTVSGVTL